MLGKMLMESGAIKRGEFILSSGKKSNYYVDIKDACAYPHILDEIVREVSKRINGKAVGGVELGAVPIVSAVSYKMKLPYFIIRKEASHGLKKILIGNPVNDMEVDIIEDVVTTGASVLRAVNVLRENGMRVKRVITVVDRNEGGREKLSENGVELIGIINVKDILHD